MKCLVLFLLLLAGPAAAQCVGGGLPCNPAGGGGPPSGSAGGDLTGSYPNPTIAATSTSLIAPPTNFPITPPSGTNNTWPGSAFHFYKSSIGYSTDFDVRSLVPTSGITRIIYFGSAGADSGNTGSSSSPYYSLGKVKAACVAGTAGQNIIAYGVLTADTVYNSTQGADNFQCVANLFIINTTPQYRMISAGTISLTPYTYTVNGTFSNVYQAPATAANAAGVTDIAVDARTQPKDPITFTPQAASPPVYKVYTKTTSIALVSTTPGSWYGDGTNIYINPLDGRDMTVVANAATMIVTPGSNNNGRYGSGNVNEYYQDVDFVGGSSPFRAISAASNAGGFLAFYHSSFQGSTSGNGISVQGPITVYTQLTLAAYNYADNFNYHDFAADNGASTSIGTSPYVIEINDFSIGAGTTGSTNASDNASTSHDNSVIIRINGVYTNSDDRPIADGTNYAQSWNMGIHVGGVLQTSAGLLESITANSTSGVLYLDGVLVNSGVNPPFCASGAAGTGGIFYRNMLPIPANTLSDTGCIGTIAPY